MIHLDTNVLVELPALAARGHPLTQKMLSGEAVAVCALVWFEYSCGPISSDEIEASRELLLVSPVTEDAARLGAMLFNAIGRKRQHRSDCLIAACAIQAQAEFFTYNAKDFRAFTAHGLRLPVLS